MFDIQNFNTFTENELKLMKENKIPFRKTLSQVLKESRASSKLSYCYYCGKETTTFCNSHLVPAFCLRNITDDGKLACLNTLIDFPLLDIEKGINEAGTFKIICRDCDSKIFSDYENPDNYINKPTPKMLGQIALKNNLKYISKRLTENEMYEVMHKDLNLPDNFYQSQSTTNQLDMVEYINGFKKAKRAVEKNWTNEYYMCYYERLNYVTPIAFQDSIAMITGFNGETINDIYNFDKKYSLKNIHICIFPLKTETIIMMFVDDGDNRYRNFYKDLKKLPLEERLSKIMFIIFAYSESVFLSKEVMKQAKSNSALVEASSKGQNILSLTRNGDFLKAAKKSFDLSNRENIINLLSEQYKIR